MSSQLNVTRLRNDRLSAAEFRALARSRGYSLAALAQLWGLTRARVSQIAADPGRAAHYDFALRGTPRRRGRAAIPGIDITRPRSPPASLDACELEIGEVFIVQDSPGEHLPEGEEGVVTRLMGSPRSGRAQLRFSGSDYEESFEVAYLLNPGCFLVRTGRLRTRNGDASEGR